MALQVLVLAQPVALEQSVVALVPVPRLLVAVVPLPVAVLRSHWLARSDSVRPF